MADRTTRDQPPPGRPEDDTAALRFSSKRPIALGWGVFAVAVVLTGVMLAGLILIPLTMPNPEGALFAVLYAVLLPVAGYGVLVGLAMTRPWWTTEVRGSTYVSRTSYFSRRNKRYDLATVTGVTFWLQKGHEGYGYFLRVRLQFPAARGEIPISLFPRDGRDRMQYRPHLRAIAGALAQHPDPAVTDHAVARLRMLASASDADTGRLLRAWRASNRDQRRARRRT
jgi:hypothetical protein